MKNFKLFKRGAALLTAGVMTMSLATGCRKDNKEEEKDLCHHLTMRVGDEYEVYKECEGYDLDVTVGSTTGTCYFEIYRNGNLLLDGTTMEYTQFDVNHDIYQNENPAFQKVKGREYN